MEPGPDDLIDALLDLQHDLGKYLRMPLAMLPADAPPAAVREAVETALRRTRRGPGGARPARALWAAFRDEVGTALARRAGWTALEAAVARALAWEAALDGGEAIDRAAAWRDLSAVADAIRALRREVEGG